MIMPEYPPLSDRELEVVRLIAEGLSSTEIAERLYISRRTVDAHRAQINRKLETNRLALVTRWAIKEGIVSA